MKPSSALKLSLYSVVVISIATQALAVDALTTTGLNLRQGPGTNYSVIEMLKAGDLVSVIRCANGWCLVTHTGTRGWVSAKYLTKPPANAGGSKASNSGNSGSAANDAAAAAAFATIFGLAANMIGNATGVGNIQIPSPPSQTYVPTQDPAGSSVYPDTTQATSTTQTYSDNSSSQASSQLLDTLPCDPVARDQYLNELEANGYEVSFLRGRVPNHCN